MLPIVTALAFAGCDEADEAMVHDGADEMADAAEAGRRIFGVPIGEDGLSYEDIDGSERSGRGPAAYLIDDRGLNWIADGPRNQVLVTDDQGEVVERYALDGLMRRIEDIEVTATHLYVLETGLAAPTVARIGRRDAAATAWESFSVPKGLEHATGLRRTEDGAILLELGLGARVRTLFAVDGNFLADGQAEVTAKHRVGAHEVELIGHDASDVDADPSAGSLVVDGVAVHDFRVAGMLAGLGFITAGRDGDFWVRVQDVTMRAGKINVRDFAYRFDLAGEVLDVVEMPVAGQSVYVHNRVALDLEGNVRALQTTPEEVALVEPAPVTVAAVATLSPGAQRPSHQDHDEPLQPRNACTTSAEIMDRAWGFVFFPGVYSSGNLDGTCANRTRPPNFNVGELITGVAYKYAGYMSVAEYDSLAAQGAVVGDITSHDGGNGVAACAVGVDCSGFVSQVWDTKSYYDPSYFTTSYMHLISTPIDVSQLIAGDALLKAGSHVRLVNQNLGSTVFVVESTTAGFNRVIGREISWGENDGYTPVRYHHHCGF